MPSLSPQIQDAGQMPPQEQAERMFKDKFTQVAYSVLSAKHSNLVPSVITLKILDVDVDTGKVVGAFVILHDNKPIYIPVLMVGGELKPIEMFYYKELNIFLPLSNEWLDEISKMSLEEMGEGADVPDEVPRDVSVRNLVVPPAPTGRYGYASEGEVDHDHALKEMLKEAENQSLEIHPKFLGVVENAPKVVLDGIKLAFERHPQLLQKFAENYGVNELTKAFQKGYTNAAAQVKVASAPGSFKVLTKYSSVDEIREILGPQAVKVMPKIAQQGYFAVDTRSLAGIEKIAVKVEGEIALNSPGPSPAWFRLWFVDGKSGIYYVMPNPADRRGEVYCRYETNRHHPIKYLVISPDAKETWTCDNVMGEPVFEEKDIPSSSKMAKAIKGEGGDTPTVNSYGFFFLHNSQGSQATKPFEIREVVTDGGRTKVSSYGTTYILDDDYLRKTIDYAAKGDLVFLPKDTKWIQIRKERQDPNSPSSYEVERTRRNSIARDPRLITRWMNYKLQEEDAALVDVKKASLNEWWIKSHPVALTFAPALEKVANEYGIREKDAVGILKDAMKNGVSTAVLVTPESFNKVASEMEKIAQPPMGPEMGGEAPMQGEMPMGGPEGGMAPPPGGEMGPGGEGMMPPAPPMQSPMSPTDIAIGEAVQQLQQQAEMQGQETQQQMQMQQQQMDQQQQTTQMLTEVLQGIQQRASEIGNATGGTIPAGAEESPGVAAQMLAPTPPAPPEPPPTPMMDAELTPENVAEQINPEMMQDAEGMQDSGMFDTAALSMLAGSPALQEIVAAYIPNLEKSLDNIGRILLTLWLTEDETTESIGDENYIKIEDQLRTLFKNLGDVILEVGHNATSTADVPATPGMGNTY